MTSHRQIMINLANAIANSSTILNYCVSKFGRGLEVNVGAYAQGIPGEAESPFLWLYAEATDNEMVAADESFTIHAVVGACVTSQNGERCVSTTLSERTGSANGVVVNGLNKAVEDLRDEMLKIVRDTSLGAIVQKIRRTENDLSHFPLEWAEFEVDVFEPETL